MGRKYGFLIDLGRKLPALPEAEKTEENRIHGCQSRVWVIAEKRAVLEGDVIEFVVDSDPEIPVSIYELGLIYDVDVATDGSANIRMTLTSPGCPVAGTLPGAVESKARAKSGATDVEVEVVWDPT